MRILLIKPNIVAKEKTNYFPSDRMQPLSIAYLASLTPDDIEVKFYDERLEDIAYDEPVDLAAITVETFSAKRSYQIADTFRKRKIPVVLGGFHPTLLPEEAKQHCDAVVIGEAEGLWPKVLEDAKNNKLKPFYRSSHRPSLEGLRPKRAIFKGKRYLPLQLVEFGRGCRYRCNFCAITSFYGYTYRHRPIPDVVGDVKELGRENIVFFIDDNIVASPRDAQELFSALIPLKIRWVGQASIEFVSNSELLQVMAESGCKGLVIGFESLNNQNLEQMKKNHNTRIKDYTFIIEKLRDKGIIIYGTFIFGYDYDDKEIFGKTLKFAIEQKLFIANFNHLIPYPKTAIYEKLLSQNRLFYERWWLDEAYHYGDVSFRPAQLSAEEVSRLCMESRVAFSRWSSILRRIEFKANCKNLKDTINYFLYNVISQREIVKKQKMLLG